MSKPTGDPDDRTTGFAITRREYNWSGCFGEALVVSFGEEFAFRQRDCKLVFWSEANYVPAWHLSNQLLQCYEFAETWGGGSVGCMEPMSDRLRRWASVEVVSTPASRIVARVLSPSCTSRRPCSVGWHLRDMPSRNPHPLIAARNDIRR